MGDRLRDKVAFITGACSGIGLATVEVLLAAGAGVALCGRDPERLDAAVRGLGAAVVGFIEADLPEVVEK